jgi:hypothetical protein
LQAIVRGPVAEQVLIMSSTCRRKARMLGLLGSLAAMTGLVADALTLYQIFCAATGCGTRPDERIGNARRQPKAQPAQPPRLSTIKVKMTERERG